MTAISTFCDTIRSWLAIGEEVYPDSVVTSWVRMAEEMLSKDLRCKDQIQIDTGTLTQQRMLLPSDWREMDFVRLVSGKALRYLPRDDFYNPDFVTDQPNCYTLSGNYLICGGTSAAGLQVEITYYQDIPPLGADPTWLSVQYPTLFTVKTLHVASLYAIEDDRGTMWGQQAGSLVLTINAEHMHSKASGSRLTRRHLKKGFG